MLSIVLSGSLLAASPPALPEDPVDTAPTEVATPEPEPEPAPAPAPAPEVVEADVIVVETPLPVADEELVSHPGTRAVMVAPVAVPPAVIVDHQATVLPPQLVYVVPPPPWSGAGRFVGGSVMLIGGVGLLTAATLEFANGRDTTQPVVSHVPAGVAMLVAGGLMIGTAARDQRRLSEWESATGITARPTGNGLIVGGVTATTLGTMAAIATSIAMDMDLDAPRSIPAGWATAGAGLGAGTAMLIAGIVRRSRYGNWRAGVPGIPMVAPARAGATVGFVGQF